MTLTPIPVPDDAIPPAQRTLAELSASCWGLAALAACVETGLIHRLGPEPLDADALGRASGVPPRLAAALLDVATALGLVVRGESGYRAPWPGGPTPGGNGAAVAADLRSTLLQTEDLFRRARTGALRTGWLHTDPDILQAQGALAAGAVDSLERFLFPNLPGIPERLDSAGGAFLDVGAGVGRVSIELARRHPLLRCVGLEPQPGPLALARANVADADLDGRVELRPERIEDLEEEAAYDVAFLPLAFIAPDVVPRALAAVFRALRPDGWVTLGTLGGGGDDLAGATARLRGVLWGGEPFPPARVAELLDDAGFADVAVVSRLPGGLVPMHARRPG
jgi:SAM-dependent methyltransferase